MTEQTKAEVRARIRKEKKQARAALAPPASGEGRWAAPHEGHQTLVRPQPLSLPTQPQPCLGAAPTLLNLSEKSRR